MPGGDVGEEEAGEEGVDETGEHATDSEIQDGERGSMLKSDIGIEDRTCETCDLERSKHCRCPHYPREEVLVSQVPKRVHFPARPFILLKILIVNRNSI